jgi:thioredoxin reductase
VPGDAKTTLETTNMAGAFAVGDSRHGPVERAASAVGEGSASIQQFHEHPSRPSDGDGAWPEDRSTVPGPV